MVSLYVLAGKSSGGRHRLGIIVYAAGQSEQVGKGVGSPGSSSMDSAGGNTSTSTPLAVLQLTGSRFRRRLSWQRLLLPTTYVQDALDSGDGVVRLRIVCDGCDVFGRRLVVEGPPTAATASTPEVDGEQATPYLEVVAKKSRGDRRLRRHRHHLCPATGDHSRLATIRRRRC